MRDSKANRVTFIMAERDCKERFRKQSAKSQFMISTPTKENIIYVSKTPKKIYI